MVKYSSPPKQNTIRTSGPNPYNYNVGRAGTLLTMMQTGGDVSPAYRRSFGLSSTAGGAALARALQQRSDADTLEEYQEAEAKRQGRGSLFGSIASTAGGLLGAAIGGPAGAALGAGLGKGLGERLGAGKSKDYDSSGTVYAQQSFEDVDEASDEYNKGMLLRAGKAGAITGLTAGLTPGGGVYGQYNPLTSTGRSGIKAGLQGLGVTGYTPTQGFTSFGRAQYEGGVGGLMGSGEQTFADKARRFLFKGRDLYNAQNGGLIGYLEGGTTGGGASSLPDTDYSSLENILGFDLTPEQEALFEKRDPSDITQGAQDIGQGLLGMTEGTGLMSADTSFGGQQKGMEQALSGSQESYERGIEESNKAFASKTAATAADIVAGGGEFESQEPEQPPNSPPSSSFPNATWRQVGADGRTYVWNGSAWVRYDG